MVKETLPPAIYIIGAGAIGKALAVFLTLKGKNVVLLRGQVKDGPASIEHITVELKNGNIISSDIQVSTINNYTSLNGIIVITTKSYGNRQIAENLRKIAGNSPIVILQNGLNVEDPFISHGFPEIYRCVLFTSSQFVENNWLRFKPAAESLIGITRGSIAGLRMIIERLNNPYFVFTAEENIQPVIWTKTIVNSVFNSVCPLFETDNGIFYRNGKALGIAKKIIEECITVAATVEVKLDINEVMERLLLISKSSDGQLISTYQDILHKRKTEIDTFNIRIALIADKAKSEELVKITRLLGELIEIKSEITMF